MKCKYIGSNEEKCNANAMRGRDFCFSHELSMVEERQQAVKRGGYAPKPRKGASQLTPIAIKSVGDILTLLEDTLNRVRTEPMTHQKANCIGYLSGIALKALEQNNLEIRLEAVEHAIKLHE